MEGIGVRRKKHYDYEHQGKIPTKPTGTEPRIAEIISRKLQLTEDMIANAPLLMGYGPHRLCLENYHHIIEYSDQLIRIQTKTGRIHIKGEQLIIAYFRDDGMCIMGNIAAIEYH